MKKLVLGYLAVLLLLHTPEVKAQQVHSLWFNAVTGLNSHWLINQNMYGNQEVEYSTAFGLTGGLGMTYFYKRYWGFNGSLMVTPMGQNYSGYQAGADANRKINLLYMEVPLLLMKEIPHMQYPTWISFGPDVLILLDANQEYSRVGGTDLPYPERIETANVKDRYKPVDVALNFSVSRMYNLDYFRKMMLLFSVNTAVGLTDITSKDWHYANTHGEYKGSHNFYIGIKAGMMFKVKKSGSRYRR